MVSYLSSSASIFSLKALGYTSALAVDQTQQCQMTRAFLVVVS